MAAPLLDDQLRRLADALIDAAPPPKIDRAIAAAIRAEPSRSRRRVAPVASDRWLAWPVGLAASIFAISFIVRQAPAEDRVPGVPVETLRQAAQSFTPVVSADEIARSGDTYVMPASVPRMTLAQLGFPVNPQRIGDAVDAELLVRADGTVLALRFVR
jgi:hypothetical protein